MVVNSKLKRGIKIIVDNWMDVRSGESVLIITDLLHQKEMLELEKYARERGAKVLLRIVPAEYSQNLSAYFDELAALMNEHQVIIGATHYSLITTEVVKRAVHGGARFLSLPMATNDGRSLLEYDFLTMDTGKTRVKAEMLLKYINDSTHLQVKTKSGTDISFRKAGRRASYFNGRARDNKGFTSSSFEIYVPIEENQTSGSGIVDGSLGYLGKVSQPFRISMEAGRIVEIEQNGDGKKLKDYMESFKDERIYHAGEFGIGLNMKSKCAGRSYIEDESSFGTFHIGFGRNIALGGEFEANGHFDIIFHEPNIYSDNRLIMEGGVIVVPELQIW